MSPTVGDLFKSPTGNGANFSSMNSFSSFTEHKLLKCQDKMARYTKCIRMQTTNYVKV
jgi:hypothetical protein